MNGFIAGRKEEIRILQELLESSQAEFLALYGRRRVGKTYLISRYYGDKGLYFELTGIKGASKQQQLKNFVLEYTRRFGKEPAKPPRDWIDAMHALLQQIEASKEKRVILFFDELPWLASARSGFLQALDHVWNRYLSRDPRVVLVVCGSAASWMIKKVVNDRAGLHGRLTRQIRLLPYSLEETEIFMKERNIHFDRKQLVELYMAIGGIPKYLREVPQGRSAAQAIQSLFFDQRGSLSNEFRRIYDSLFDGATNHIEVVRQLAQHPSGLTKSELLKHLPHISSGGGFTSILTELEESGFIQYIPQFKQKKKNGRYLLTDEYSLFYLRWVEPVMGGGGRKVNPDHWLRQQQSAAYKSWSGYAFESVCLKHIEKILRALGITAVTTSASGWRGKGAQIDLVIDRADRCINLCEMKFYSDSYVMTKEYAAKLNKRKQLFKQGMRTRSTLFTTLIAANGADRNSAFLSVVDQLLTLDDLFE